MPKKAPKKSAAKTEVAPTYVVTDHVLVPKHDVCTQAEKEEILTRYKAQPSQMPRITASDPAIRHLGVKVGDLIKIARNSETAGTAVFYRIVSSE
jgi:DNA-directed RNA polymerase subunit H (RpoH/RPB5)